MVLPKTSTTKSIVGLVFLFQAFVNATHANNLLSTNIPSEADLKAQVMADPNLNSLSGEQKEIYIAMAQIRVMRDRHAWNQACLIETASICANSDNTAQCLVNNISRLSSCCAAFTKQIGEDKNVHQSVFHKGVLLPSDSIITYEHECVSSKATTTSAVWFNGLMLKAGRIDFYPDAGVRHATLAYDQPFNGFQLSAAGQGLAFHPSGVPVSAQITTLSVTPYGTYSPGKRPVQFSADGSVRFGYLAAKLVVDGVVYGPTATGPTEIEFYETGKVKEATLGENAQIGDISLPIGTRIKWPERQGYIFYTAPAESIIGSIQLQGGSEVTAYHNQTLREGTLAKHTLIDNRYYAKGARIKLSSSGSVRWDSVTEKRKNQYYERIKKITAPRTITSSKTINGVVLPAGSELMHDELRQLRTFRTFEPFYVERTRFQAGHYQFNNNHGVMQGKLESDQVIGSIRFKAGETVFFDRDSNVKQGVLAENTHDAEFLYKADTQVTLSSDGSITEGTLARGTKINGTDIPSMSIVKWSRYAPIVTEVKSPVEFLIDEIPVDGRRVKFTTITIGPELVPLRATLKSPTIDHQLRASHAEQLTPKQKAFAKKGRARRLLIDRSISLLVNIPEIPVSKQSLADKGLEHIPENLIITQTPESVSLEFSATPGTEVCAYYQWTASIHRGHSKDLPMTQILLDGVDLRAIVAKLRKRTEDYNLFCSSLTGTHSMVYSIIADKIEELRDIARYKLRLSQSRKTRH